MGIPEVVFQGELGARGHAEIAGRPVVKDDLALRDVGGAGDQGVRDCFARGCNPVNQIGEERDSVTSGLL